MNKTVKAFLYGLASGILFLTVAIILKPDLGPTVITVCEDTCIITGEPLINESR